ncbi:sodium/potassium-transporting ATPase subunit beta-1-like [Epargyreus clarus]|uniref:sodium/potassium-transporting ATPase subunit beta-1-like n=1 Tax=Epargyreus clarus TaxID=520877 RepID=UPI003C2B9A00
MPQKDKPKIASKSRVNDTEQPSTSTKVPLKRASLPTSSKNPSPDGKVAVPAEPEIPWRKRCWNYIYDKENGLFCGRTCKSWWYMTAYSIMYLLFLCTYTMIFLYASLTLVKFMEIYNVVDKSELMTYSENGIGLTAVPTSLDIFPFISYTSGQSDEYNKYVKVLDEFLVKRRKRQVTNSTDLGPCGTAPYGYGDEPCVIIRLNKQLRWSAKPYNASTKDLPKDLQEWMLKEQKLWLHCDGYHSYDKEHIGRIKYYPYPPGFDPGIFPLDMQSETPLIAIQLSNFTLGLSLAVECKLCYDNTVSSVTFLLYVEPKSRSVRNY